MDRMDHMDRMDGVTWGTVGSQRGKGGRLEAGGPRGDVQRW